jgi:DNA-binding LacI/PurR family transcriptional regulator
MSQPTIRDVATEAGVSLSAVSLYLNNKPGLGNETRERIAGAVEKLGYIPRARNRPGVGGGPVVATSLIGLLLENLPFPAFSDILYLQVLQGFESEARRQGYHTVITTLDTNDTLEVPAAVLDGQFAGLVALGGGDVSDDFLRAVSETGVPLVLVDNYLLTGEVDCVVPDNEMGAYFATRHLIERGHRRIAAIAGPPKYKPLTDRLQGYLRAMHEAGLGPEPWMIQHSLSHGMANKGYREMQALLACPERPTAVFCVSDRTALSALTALNETGLRVPDDIALTGFDNVPESAYSTPALTTVQMPKRDMGIVAARRLAELIGQDEGEPLPRKILLPTHLVVRKST